MSGYVELFSVGNLPSNLQGDFNNAVRFWNTVITSGASPSSLNNDLDMGRCGLNGVTFPSTIPIPGVAIVAQIAAIDGTGGILGSAGPCISDNQNFVRIGVMNFDSADSNSLANQGQFEEVVRHEMAHVLGMGTLWQGLGLLRNAGSNDPTYRGANGNSGLAALGGSGEIPIANTGGAGTAGGHWREATFQNELMTGFLSAGTNPASIMTVRSLRDLGFQVNENAAQAYSIPRGKSAETEGKGLQLMNDVSDFDVITIEELNTKSPEELGLVGKTFEHEVQRVSMDTDNNIMLFSGIALMVAAAVLAFFGVMVVKRQRKTEEVVAEENKEAVV